MVLLVTMLSLLAVQSPWPWGGLWLLVPGAVAVSLLTGWRFGAWGVLVPILFFAVTLAVEGPHSLWAWWVPVASLTGVWMGLREETEGGLPGRRASMLFPVLLLAAGLPWMLRYPDLLHTLEQEFRQGDQQFLGWWKELSSGGERLASMQKTIEENAKLRARALPYVLPSVLFVWVAFLIAAGRTIASRCAGVLKWPALARTALARWRLPDGALAVLLAGLGAIVFEWRAALPAAWTLLINTGLGYCIQGIAVVESLLLARGVPPSIIVVTMIFVFTLAMPVFLLTTVAVGLSDVWLDYRRLESPREPEN
jgi:hypothetical protein